MSVLRKRIDFKARNESLCMSCGFSIMYFQQNSEENLIELSANNLFKNHF